MFDADTMEVEGAAGKVVGSSNWDDRNLLNLGPYLLFRPKV